MAKYITQCKLNYFNSNKAGKIAIVTMDNGEDYRKPNTWGLESLASMNEVLDQVEKEPDLKGWILTGKPFIFNAGADIMSFQEGVTKELAAEVAKMGHDTFMRILNLNVPTVAAINGASLGGGFEVSLYHDYRTIAKSPGGADIIALPEAFLGLVPGWGGSQLIPRIAGAETAIEFMIKNPLSQNRMSKSAQIMQWGLADRMFEPVEFLDDSIEFLENIITGAETIEKKTSDPAMSDKLYQDTYTYIKDKVHSGTKAPYLVLDLIKAASQVSLQEGFAKEEEALTELIMSRQFRSSIYSFDLVQRRAKKAPGRPVGVTGNPVARIGIIGAGLMASQIALLFLQRFKVPVLMKDIKQEFVDKGTKYIEEQLQKQVEKGRLSESDAKWMANDLLIGTTTYDGFDECDFVIEGIFEEMGIKQSVFSELESACKPECLFLTNTSSLDVTEMASKLKDPSRVVGFHFFNPIAVLPLVEVIKAEHSSDIAVATAFDIAKKIKKTPVLVKNSPGFLVNRIIMAGADGVMDAIDLGAEIQQADNAVLDMGFPMSTFVLLQFTGPPVALHVQETLHKAWPDRFKINPGLKAMVDKKKMGIYKFGPSGFEVDPEISEAWERGTQSFTDDEIREHAMVRVAKEIDLILKEEIVASYQDIDTAMIMGAGYPFFNGGITAMLDQLGYSEKALGHKIQVD